MMDERWLSDDEYRAWKKMIAVVERLPRALEAQLQRDSMMTHFEYYTLAMLSQSTDRKLRITALATATNSTAPRLSHVLTRLEKRGLVRREPSLNDGRAIKAVLTKEGWEAVVHAAPDHVRAVRENVIDGLDATDIADLERIMGRIIDRLDA